MVYAVFMIICSIKHVSTHNMIVYLNQRKHQQYKDQFFGRFYDSLAQIIFQSFYSAYPKSRMSFDDDFKLTLIDTCAEWTTGLVPSRPSWLHWAHEQDMKGSKRRMDLGSLGRSSAGKGTAAGGRESGRTKLTKWNRAVRTNQSLTYSPLISQFMANEQHRNSLVSCTATHGTTINTISQGLQDCAHRRPLQTYSADSCSDHIAAPTTSG